MDAWLVDPERWQAWDRHVQASADSGFMQSSWWARFREPIGFDHFGVTFKHEGAIVGGALVSVWERAPGHCFYYIQDGPLLPRDGEPFARQVFEDKTRAEQTLVASGLRYTIVRTGVLLGGEPSGRGLLSEDHSLLAPMRVADIARETAACVAAPRCYDRIYHTVDPSLAGLTPEQVAAEKLKLRDLKAWRRQ